MSGHSPLHLHVLLHGSDRHDDQVYRVMGDGVARQNMLFICTWLQQISLRQLLFLGALFSAMSA